MSKRPADDAANPTDDAAKRFRSVIDESCDELMCSITQALPLEPVMDERAAGCAMYGPILPCKGDERLYEFDGDRALATALTFTDAEHRHTTDRWLKWRAGSQLGNALRTRIEILRRELADRTGDLLQSWGGLLDEKIKAYLDLNKAAESRLPLNML